MSFSWSGQTTANRPSGPGQELHVNFQLNKGGDILGLFAPDGSPQHIVRFGPQLANVSEGLFPDGLTNRVVAMPDWTPGTSNIAGEAIGPN